MSQDLNLILKDITDVRIRENFFRIQKYVQNQTILLAGFTFFEVIVSQASTKFAIPHGLNFIPVDIIPLSFNGNQNVAFLYQEFDTTNIYVQTDGPVKMRFLAGRYNQPGYEKAAVDFTLVPLGEDQVTLFSKKSYYMLDTDNSSHSYALVASDTSYQYYNNITWSMWAAVAPNVNRTLWSMYDETPNARSWLFSTQGDGTFRIIGSWDGTNICLFKTLNAVHNFGWLHIVVTFASGVFTCYINGVLQTLGTTIAWGGGSTLFAANKQMMIGSFDPTAPPIDVSPAGCVMNFSMFNTVLNGDQINELYNGGIPTDLKKFSKYANLTNWFRMDQSDNTTTLTDSKAGITAAITQTGSGVFQQSTNVPGIAAI